MRVFHHHFSVLVAYSVFYMSNVIHEQQHPLKYQGRDQNLKKLRPTKTLRTPSPRIASMGHDVEQPGEYVSLKVTDFDEAIQSEEKGKSF